ncbi:hypothetical protein D3C75_1046600 [compost metagenome]
MLLEFVLDLEVRLTHFYERFAVRTASDHAAVVVGQDHDGGLGQVRAKDAFTARVEAVAVDQREDRLRLSDHEHAR